MTITITINLWHVVWGFLAYIGVGLLTYVPLNYLAVRHINISDQYRPKLWRGWVRFLVQVVAWPLAIAEERGWL